MKIGNNLVKLEAIESDSDYLLCVVAHGIVRFRTKYIMGFQYNYKYKSDNHKGVTIALNISDSFLLVDF